MRSNIAQHISEAASEWYKKAADAHWPKRSNNDLIDTYSAIDPVPASFLIARRHLLDFFRVHILRTELRKQNEHFHSILRRRNIRRKLRHKVVSSAMNSFFWCHVDLLPWDNVMIGEWYSHSISRHVMETIMDPVRSRLMQKDFRDEK